MKNFITNLINKLTTKTKEYKVRMEFQGDGWRIITPFCPGKGPWSYGSGVQVGDQETTFIEIVMKESPYTQTFKEEE